MDNSAPIESKTGLTASRISALCFFPLCGFTTSTNLIVTPSELDLVWAFQKDQCGGSVPSTNLPFPSYLVRSISHMELVLGLKVRGVQLNGGPPLGCLSLADCARNVDGLDFI